MVTLNLAKNIDSGENPARYTEVVSCNDCSKWIVAMQDEIKSLQNVVLSKITQGEESCLM